jgi:hypothetical protein
VNAGMRQMGRHSLDCVVSREPQKLAIGRRVELQDGGSELEALRPFRPAARLPSTVHREHWSAIFGAPGGFEAADFGGGNLEQAVDPRQQIGWSDRSVAMHQASEAPYDM